MPFWGPFGEIFCIIWQDVLMRFRTCSQRAFLMVLCHFGVPFGSICVHFGKLFDVIWRLFWPKAQKCKKCVWTAQACTDCMCDLPEKLYILAILSVLRHQILIFFRHRFLQLSWGALLGLRGAFWGPLGYPWRHFGVPLGGYFAE